MFKTFFVELRRHLATALPAGLILGICLGGLGGAIYGDRYRPLLAATGLGFFDVVVQWATTHAVALAAVSLPIAVLVASGSAVGGRRWPAGRPARFYLALLLACILGFAVAVWWLPQAASWRRLSVVGGLTAIPAFVGWWFLGSPLEGRRRRPERLPPLLGPLSALLVCAFVAFGGPGQGDRPLRDEAGVRGGGAIPPANVLLLVADTLRADRLGAYGYPRRTTPVLDELARQGTLYRAAISQAPNTHPSMASILTSRPVVDFGLEKNSISRLDLLRDYLGSDKLSLAEMLAGNGYRTAAVITNAWLKRAAGFAQGFEHFDDSTCINRDAACVTREGLAWLDHAARPGGNAAPFFLWLHYIDPHHPYDPRPPHDETFTDPERQVRPLIEDLRSQDVGRQTRFFKAVGAGRYQLSEAELAHLEALYDGEIRHLDSEIGVFLAALRQRRLFDDTLVVFTADHGEEFLDHDGMLHAATLYDEVLHVPLILRFPPRLAAGSDIERQVSTLDIVPTILELVGLGGRYATAGRSLVNAEPTTTVVESRLGPHLVSCRTSNWKLISPADCPGDLDLAELASQWARVFGRLEEEFYDLGRDPGETRNLLGDGRIRLRLPEPESAGDGLDEETREQLRSLGYLD